MKSLLTIFFFALTLPLCAQTLDTAAIRRAVERQLRNYPESTLQDIYKSFYQNRFGTGHMISDSVATERYLYKELEAMVSDPATDERRYWDPVGADTQHVRIYLQAVVDGRVTPQQLNSAFFRSAQVQRTVPFDWATEWETIQQVIHDNHLSVAEGEADSARLAEMSRTNAAAHHSRRYNAAYHPHYRVVRKELFLAMRLQ
ncbi:MAG: hypothetical protein IJT39_00150 [Bacteroidales bacterium]|nr:hypothetical protein [Bacteroidales bacterium]